MWLFNSSVGRKFVMSLTGISLVLFLTFHAAMNLVVVISPEGYNMICEFLGANWYALVATAGLAGLAVLHVLYAFILTVQNYAARGKDRYAVDARQKGVSWASKNMLVLGFIILGFMGLHLYNFWYNMQFAEIIGVHDLGPFSPTDGAAYVKALFASPAYCIAYLVWFVAIWYHLTHGIWSSLHSLGLNNNTWMPRVKCIANIYATIVMLMFASVVVFYFVQSLMA